MALAIAVAVPGIATAKLCEDDAAVAAAREAADTQCGCETSETHGAYVRCVNEVAKQRVATGALPRECQSEVTACAARSICGRSPGAVTCCRVGGDGDVSCEIQPSAEACEALSGVSCVGATISCCDACEGSPGGAFVCGGTTTTSAPPATTSSTTTTTGAPTTSTAAPTTSTSAAPSTTTAAPTTSTAAPTTSTVAPTTTTTEEPTTSSTSSSTTTTLIGSPSGAFLGER